MMGKGKILSLVGGILTLISTYLLAWYVYEINYVVYYYNGIGAIENFLDLYVHAQNYADYLELPLWIIYLWGLVIIVTLISGGLQLLSLKNRIWGLIGSIMPIIISIVIILGLILFPEWLKYLEIFGDSNPLIRGGFPLNLALPARPESLGTYVLFAGGILGVIGFYYSSEEFY